MQRTIAKMTPAQLRAWINRHDLTIPQTAETLGKSIRTIYGFLSGEHAIELTVEKLCKALDSLRKAEKQ